MRNISLLSLGFCAAAQAGTLLGPSPYLQASDSPFAALTFDTFSLENFEDGAFNVANASISGGTATPAGGAFTDSVDGDDGLIDGSGVNGRSWYSNNSISTIEIAFTPLLGQYPTHAGVVWTDVGNVLSGSTGFGDVIFEAFAPGGGSLGSTLLAGAGDGVATGDAAEDRFFGAINIAGIERIVLSMPNSVDWELDHVQFGIVPEPASLTLLALLATAARRR
ncbi:MAG: hypothetical protein SF069_07660 [Phycisphaerae bacterium]|nr:hypothetical protein [Phycisphaerae bacterium]